MRREVLMPKLGLTMTEGALAEWMLEPGATFKAGDGLFVVETDKVANEVPADSDGTLVEIVVQVGETVEVGAVIGYIDDGAAATAESKSAPAAAPAGDSVVATPAVTPQSTAAGVVPAAGNGQRVVATPLARRIAVQLGVALSGIAGSGPRGRIKAADVQGAASAPARVPSSGAPNVQPPTATPITAPLAGTRVKPTPMQSTIARRLTQAKQQVPHFYLAAEVEVTRLNALRLELNAIAGYPKVTMTHLLVAGVARALQALPEFNRVWTDDAIVAFGSCDVGVAVNTDRGLLVPIVRDVGARPFRELSFAVQASVEKARSGALTGADMAGGAISISNAGMFNVTYMTPIINPGQSLILGVGSVREVFRPDAQGQPALRRELGLVLAGDHRIFDGVSGLRFLNAVVQGLEQPLGLVA
ncbi:dihydrolipoamide acetyltransferase family protein [Xylophilus sp. GW821-FHT01B05]